MQSTPGCLRGDLGLRTERSGVGRGADGAAGAAAGFYDAVWARLRMRAGVCLAMLGHGVGSSILCRGGSCARTTASRLGSSGFRLVGRASLASPVGDRGRLDRGRRRVVSGRGARCGAGCVGRRGRAVGCRARVRGAAHGDRRPSPGGRHDRARRDGRGAGARGGVRWGDHRPDVLGGRDARGHRLDTRAPGADGADPARSQGRAAARRRAARAGARRRGQDGRRRRRENRRGGAGRRHCGRRGGCR